MEKMEIPGVMIVEEDDGGEREDRRERKEGKTGSPLNLTLPILEAGRLPDLDYPPATSIQHSPYNSRPWAGVTRRTYHAHPVTQITPTDLIATVRQIPGKRLGHT